MARKMTRKLGKHAAATSPADPSAVVLVCDKAVAEMIMHDPTLNELRDAGFISTASAIEAHMYRARSRDA